SVSDLAGNHTANTPFQFQIRAAAAPGRGDFNGDGYADVLIHNSSTGQNQYANMAGGSFSGWGLAGTAPGWNVVGHGDINHDGDADIVIQNQSRQIVDSDMASGESSGWASLTNVPGWTAKAVADVNGDGYADVVIENSQSGQIEFANMANGSFSGWGFAGT